MVVVVWWWWWCGGVEFCSSVSFIFEVCTPLTPPQKQLLGKKFDQPLHLYKVAVGTLLEEERASDAARLGGVKQGRLQGRLS